MLKLTVKISVTKSFCSSWLRTALLSECLLFSCYTQSYIWCDIFVNCYWVDTQWQYYSTHLHTNNTYNTINNKNNTINNKNTTNNLIGKIAARAPSLWVIPWHLPYNWGKNFFFNVCHPEVFNAYTKYTILLLCLTEQYCIFCILRKKHGKTSVRHGNPCRAIPEPLQNQHTTRVLL